MSDDRRERRGDDRPRGRAGDERRARTDRDRGQSSRPRRDGGSDSAAPRSDAGRGYPSREDREGGYRGREERGAQDRDRGGQRRDRDDRGQRGGRGREDREGGYRGRPQADRADRPVRTREPEIPEDIEAGQLDKVLRSELLTLSKDNAEGTARHLVAVGRALDEEDLDAALAHAQAASKRAGRVAGVRETLGVVHYRRGEWAKALAEFRTARRLSGLNHLLPLMADAERGLGRPERALDLAGTPEARKLPPAELIEMAIVVSGARGDMGQTAAAVQHLRDLAHAGSPKAPWAARLRYAYAAALEADGQADEAQEWYRRAAEVDVTGETDAAEMLGLEPAPELIDLGGPEDDEPTPDTGHGSRPDTDEGGRAAGRDGQR